MALLEAAAITIGAGSAILGGRKLLERARQFKAGKRARAVREAKKRAVETEIRDLGSTEQQIAADIEARAAKAGGADEALGGGAAGLSAGFGIAGPFGALVGAVVGAIAGVLGPLLGQRAGEEVLREALRDDAKARGLPNDDRTLDYITHLTMLAVHRYPVAINERGQIAHVIGLAPHPGGRSTIGEQWASSYVSEGYEYLWDEMPDGIRPGAYPMFLKLGSTRKRQAGRVILKTFKHGPGLRRDSQGRKHYERWAEGSYDLVVLREEPELYAKHAAWVARQLGIEGVE